MSRDRQPKAVQVAFSPNGRMYVLMDDGTLWARNLNGAKWHQVETP